MFNFKLVILAVLASFIATSSWAQTEDTGETVAPTPYSAADQNSIDDYEDDKGSLILSFVAIATDRVKEVQDREDNELNYGGGILVEANINDNFGIETGALVVNRQYEIERLGVRVVEEVQRIHVPITARFWATDFFSLAAGPYLAFKTGSTKTSLEIGDINLGNFKTSADDSVEYGLDAAATINLAVNDKTGVFVEGRYSKMLNEENDEDGDQVSALAGLKLDL